MKPSFLPSFRNCTTLLTAAFVGACGDSGGGGTAGEPPPDTPGFVVECNKDLMGDQLVCMSPEDWNCSVQGHYVRESICARLWGGTPADYDDKVVLSKDDRFEGTFDCAHLPEPVEDDPETPEDETVPEILLGVGLGTGCDNCRVCDSQLAGWFANGAPDDAWNEFPACPGKAEDPQGNPYPDNDALNAWCGGEPDPTTGGGGGTTTGGGGGPGFGYATARPPSVGP